MRRQPPDGRRRQPHSLSQHSRNDHPQLSTASTQPDLITKLASIKDVAESKLATAANAVADAKTDTGKSADKYDYVVVGSGPGGATVAHQLTANPKLRVLVLKAGPDADAAPPITVSSNAWMLPVMYVPQYFWQMATMPFVTNFDATNALPQAPTRRRQLLHDHTTMEQYMGGRLLSGSSSINGEQVSLCWFWCACEGDVGVYALTMALPNWTWV